MSTSTHRAAAPPGGIATSVVPGPSHRTPPGKNSAPALAQDAAQPIDPLAASVLPPEAASITNRQLLAWMFRFLRPVTGIVVRTHAKRRDVGV